MMKGDPKLKYQGNFVNYLTASLTHAQTSSPKKRSSQSISIGKKCQDFAFKTRFFEICLAFFKSLDLFSKLYKTTERSFG